MLSTFRIVLCGAVRCGADFIVLKTARCGADFIICFIMSCRTAPHHQRQHTFSKLSFDVVGNQSWRGMFGICLSRQSLKLYILYKLWDTAKPQRFFALFVFTVVRLHGGPVFDIFMRVERCAWAWKFRVVLVSYGATLCGSLFR